MRLTAAFAFVLPLCAQDAREIVRVSLEREAAFDKIARQYTFLQRIEQRDIGDSGKIARRRTKTYDVTLLEGSPYSRLIAREDRPLSADEEKEERRKLERSIQERRRETERARIKRVSEWQQKRDDDRKQFSEIVDAFKFQITGEEAINGQSCWVIEATPSPEYRPHGGMSRVFPKIRGRMWISKANYGWARVEAETLDTITYGGFLARLHKGMRFFMEQEHVNGEVWMPKHITVDYSARVLLVKRLRGQADVTYRDFRKFQANSRIVDISETEK